METFKLLTEMVKDLPDMAIWVIIIFFAYKVVIVGSLYGLIRCVVQSICKAIKTNKELSNKAIELGNEAIELGKFKAIDVRAKIADECITTGGAHSDLIQQIKRIRNGGLYIHRSDVLFLKAAITKHLKDNPERAKRYER